MGSLFETLKGLLAGSEGSELPVTDLVVSNRADQKQITGVVKGWFYKQRGYNPQTHKTTTTLYSDGPEVFVERQRGGPGEGKSTRLVFIRRSGVEHVVGAIESQHPKVIHH